MWHNRKPSLNYLTVFSSTTYVHNKTNGLKLWDVKSQKFIVARDVIVDETNKINSRTVVEECNNGLHIFQKECTECNQSETRNEIVSKKILWKVNLM